jgi:uncharacterized protein YqgQ
MNYIVLSSEILFDLYELIIDDMIDKDAYMAAKYIINKCINNNKKMVNENK